MRFAALLVVLVCACSSSRDSDASTDGLTAADGDVVMCPGTFPTFDMVCATDADCRAGDHVTSCCGSSTAIGIASHELARFQTDEAVCDAQYPGCGCASGSIMTSSGETTFDFRSVQVGCITVGPTARCETYVSMRPPPGR